LPASFYAEVTSELEQPHGILNLGHVHCPLEHAESEEALWLAMLIQLAGAEAEFLLSGSRWAGTFTDTAAWTQFATTYLACGFGGVFFSLPATETEIKYNVSAYDRLRETQKAALAEFLTQNSWTSGAAGLNRSVTLDAAER
jgi:hypothetical protein